MIPLIHVPAHFAAKFWPEHELNRRADEMGFILFQIRLFAIPPNRSRKLVYAALCAQPTGTCN